MARTKAELGSGARLSDYLSASLLARVYPADWVHQALNEHGANSKRVRSLPAVGVAYYCMALSLYPEAAYEDVFAVVAQGLSWMQGSQAVQTPASSSISVARSKMGYAPLQALHERACVALADPEKQPHAILGANLGPYRAAEWEICKPLLPRLVPGMLCLADRGFNGYAHWKAACDTGAQLLWRGVANRQLPVVEELDDGSYLSAIYPDVKSRRSRAEEIVVRVIEYSLPGVPDAQDRYRLITTLLDPVRAPALELATLYHERWEVEGVFDELKTHLLQRRRTLRSKTPDGVRQEFYGWVLAHYAVCWLMHEAASAHRVRQRSLSFTGHVHLLRRAQPLPGDFFPGAAQASSALVS